VLIVLVLTAIRFDWLWRTDHLIYDGVLKLLERDAPEDVVIVGIDERSLTELGRWPWPRDLHAQLLLRLKEYGVKGVGFDVIFSERNVNEVDHDVQLADAIAQVPIVLPVLVEPPEAGAQLIEILPFPELAEAATSLAHVHVELDRDGIARGVYLRAGIGHPFWANFGLALLEMVQATHLNPLPGARAPVPETESLSRNWVRDHRVLIPFAGPPGHFTRLSYSQVLSGQINPDVLRDKIVFVGMTTAGLDDHIPTPVSGHGQFMPGVEFNANVFFALRQGVTIEPIAIGWTYAISIFLVLMTLFIYPRSRPLFGVVTAVGIAASALIISAILLVAFKQWFAPSGAMLGIVASYPLWSWRRLESAFKYLRDELTRLRAEQELSPAPSTTPNVDQAVSYMQSLLPDYHWRHIATSNPQSPSTATAANARGDIIASGEWTRFNETRWTSVEVDGLSQVVGVDAPPRPAASWETELLDDFAIALGSRTAEVPSSRVELLETHIRQVQHARDQLREMRSLVDDSLAQMADGVIVVSELGQIVTANRQSAKYLLGSPNVSLEARPILPLLESLRSERGDVDWIGAIREVMSTGMAVRRDARHADGTDLLVQLAPLRRSAAGPRIGTMILNLADVTTLKEAERRRAELMSFLSHDLRSPLVSILALVELSEQREDIQGLRELIVKSRSYAERSLGLLEQFLELTRAESSERLRLHENDLVTLSVNAYEQTWALASAKGINFTQDFDVEEAWIWADAELVERAIINLLNNAIKYSPAGASVRLRVGQGPERGFFCSISDTGPGIADQDLGKLFERFERLTAHRRTERGTGLGLTFVKAVTDRHSGRIEVDSEIGRGSTFTLHFPAHDLAEPDLAEPLAAD
ncbi:MAG: CHASE2 domain-containing protein, partial [Gammaproteobacteria bacterium]|nr:CHASE2 domain-containing protein [Gammaproteobacteria bacterium]